MTISTTMARDEHAQENRDELFPGHVGSADRLEFTVVGAAVNRAHRLQALAGPGQVVMSDAMHELVTEHMPAPQSLGAISLKGFQEPIQLVVWQVRARAA
jgi:adenylate cyclase